MNYQELLSALDQMKQAKKGFNAITFPFFMRFVSQMKQTLAIPAHCLIQCHKRTNENCAVIEDCVSTHEGVSTLQLELIIDTDKLGITLQLQKSETKVLRLHVSTCGQQSDFYFPATSHVESFSFADVYQFIYDTMLARYRRLQTSYEIN
jgi:hypothetical protein